MHTGDLISMSETLEELQREKKEREEENKHDKITGYVFVGVVLAFLVGYAIGYYYGAFEGFQLALKQFHIVQFAPVLIP